MNRVLNATVQRTADHAAPEITLDPLEIVGGKTSYADQQAQQQRLHSQTSEFAHITEPPEAGSPGLGDSPHPRGFHRQVPRMRALRSRQHEGGRGPFPYISPWPHLLQGRVGHGDFILVGQGPANIGFLASQRGAWVGVTSPGDKRRDQRS